MKPPGKDAFEVTKAKLNPQPSGGLVPIAVTKLSDAELENLITNHRRHNATDHPLYLEVLEERARRKGRGLNFEKSFEIIRRSAGQRRFLSYKDLAEASGAEWTRVRYSIGEHLWYLVEFAHRKGWPMLSAIVVNKPHVQTGDMDPVTLKGFVVAARELGYAVIDAREFLREQQAKVFDWAANTDRQA